MGAGGWGGVEKRQLGVVRAAFLRYFHFRDRID